MAKKNQTPPRSFEDGLAELEQIVGEIEAGQIGLEESLARQERGQFLLHYCRGVLDKAEQQIQVLSKSGDGELRATPAGPSLQGASGTRADDAEGDGMELTRGTDPTSNSSQTPRT